MSGNILTCHDIYLEVEGPYWPATLPWTGH